MDRIFDLNHQPAAANPPNINWFSDWSLTSLEQKNSWNEIAGRVNSPLLLIIQQWYEFMSTAFFYQNNLESSSEKCSRKLCKRPKERWLDSRWRGTKAYIRLKAVVYCNWTPLSISLWFLFALKIQGVSIGVYFRIGNKSSIAISRQLAACTLRSFHVVVLESLCFGVVMKEAEIHINKAL